MRCLHAGSWYSVIAYIFLRIEGNTVFGVTPLTMVAAGAADKAWLQKTDAEGISVYGHLTDVLARLLETRPADALQALESISKDVKDGHFTSASAETAPAPTSLPDSESSDAWQRSNNALLKARHPLPIRSPAACRRSSR